MSTTKPVTSRQKIVLWLALPLLCIAGACLVAWSSWQIYATYQLDQKYLSVGKTVVGKVIDLQPQRLRAGIGWSRLVEYEKSSGEKATLLVQSPVIGVSLTKSEALAQCSKKVELEYLPSMSEIRKKPPSGVTDRMPFLMALVTGVVLFVLSAYSVSELKSLD
jgi:hypothetical protein